MYYWPLYKMQSKTQPRHVCACCFSGRFIMIITGNNHVPFDIVACYSYLGYKWAFCPPAPVKWLDGRWARFWALLHCPDPTFGSMHVGGYSVLTQLIKDLLAADLGGRDLCAARALAWINLGLCVSGHTYHSILAVSATWLQPAAAVEPAKQVQLEPSLFKLLDMPKVKHLWPR